MLLNVTCKYVIVNSLRHYGKVMTNCNVCK